MSEIGRSFVTSADKHAYSNMPGRPKKRCLNLVEDNHTLEIETLLTKLDLPDFPDGKIFETNDQLLC